MGLTEFLFLSALLLIVIDIFFLSDVSTHIAWVLLSLAIVSYIPLSLMYKALIGVVIWFLLVLFHYTLWRLVMEKISNKIIAPTKHESGTNGFVGQLGEITLCEGKLFLLVKDELHSFDTIKQVAPGEVYKVVQVKGNKLII